jgi:NADH:ubiquinone oxidoreductase subunit H
MQVKLLIGKSCAICLFILGGIGVSYLTWYVTGKFSLDTATRIGETIFIPITLYPLVVGMFISLIRTNPIDW